MLSNRLVIRNSSDSNLDNVTVVCSGREYQFDLVAAKQIVEVPVWLDADRSISVKWKSSGQEFVADGVGYTTAFSYGTKVELDFLDDGNVRFDLKRRP